MSTERTPLTPVAGLSRTAQLPAPPARRPQASNQPAPGRPPATVTPERAPEPAPATTEPPAKRPVSSTATTTRNVTLSLPTSLVAQVRARARQDRTSQPDLLLDALTAAEPHLPRLLAAAAPHETTEGPFMRRTPRPENPDPVSTFSLRLLSPNLDAIDTMVDKYEADSRSALCAVALRHYLHTPGSQQS